MIKMAWQSAAALLALILLPAIASAQAAITGVVKDTSGGVLPGVTVEAASPVLIEKVRSVVSDDTGQYRIVDLRPGTYSVTFTLARLQHRQARRHRAVGHVRRHGQRRPEGRRARGDDHGHRRDADRGRPERAGRSRRSARTSSPRFPRSRNVGRHPGPDSRDEHRDADSGGITGALTGRRRAPSTAGAATIRGSMRTASTWAGPAAAPAAGTCRRWRASQEVVMTTSGGLGEAETGGRRPQRHSARGQPTPSAASSPSAARTTRCRAATTRRR